MSLMPHLYVGDGGPGGVKVAVDLAAAGAGHAPEAPPRRKCPELLIFLNLYIYIIYI